MGFSPESYTVMTMCRLKKENFITLNINLIDTDIIICLEYSYGNNGKT